MSDNNTYYTCKCIYFDGGFITCRICSEWVYNTSDNTVKPKSVIFVRRRLRYQYSPKDKGHQNKYIDK